MPFVLLPFVQDIPTPLAHWPLYGNANEIINGRNGSPQGSITYVNDRFDNANQGLRLNGATDQGDYISIVNDPVWNLQKFTINAWFRWFDNDDTWARIIDRGYVTGTPKGWNMHVHNNVATGDGRVSMEIGNGSINRQAICPIALEANRCWAMYTGTFDGRFLKMYVNGGYPAGGTNPVVVDCGAGYTIDYTGINTNMWIGRAPQTNASWFNGVINDVQVWDTDLDEDQLKSLFREQSRNFLIDNAKFPRPYMGFGGGNGWGSVGGPPDTALPSPLADATGERTVEFLFVANKSIAGSALDVIYEEGGGDETDGNGLVMYVDNGRLRVMMWSNANGWGTDEVSVALTSRFVHHAALAYKWTSGTNGYMKVYVNGELAAQRLTGLGQLAAHVNGGGLGAVHQSTNLFGIGSTGSNGSNGFDGSVVYCRHWDIERTQQQIIDNILVNMVGNESNLIANWRIDEGSGATLNDSTANNNDIFMNGTYNWFT